MYRSRHKAVQLMVKTHKTTIFLSCPQEMTFTEAKEKILSALTQFPDELDVPKVASTDDFEICVGRLSKKPGEGTSQSKLEFEIIDGEKRMRDVYNKPWETGYLKFKNSDGTFRPVQVKFANLVEDDPEEDEEQ